MVCKMHKNVLDGALATRRKIVAILACLLFLCPYSYAFAHTDRGFVVGLDVGYGVVDYSGVTLTGGFQPTRIRDTGIAPKIAIGYEFNPYFGLGVSVIYFLKPVFEGLGETKITGKMKHNLVALWMKPSLPLFHQFSLYGQFGVGYIVRDSLKVRRGMSNINAIQGGEFGCWVYGLGVSYRVATHWLLDLTWIQAPASLSRQIPAANYYGVGAAYKF